jgi:predicted TPR repeat methyltransferase
MELHRAGRFEEAEHVYRTLLRARPEDPNVLHFFGVLLHQTRRSAEGVRLIEKSIALDPGHPDAHNNLANVLKEQGRLDEALAAYGRAIALAPAYADAHNNTATILRAQDRLDEALAACDRALAHDADHAAAHVNRGNILKQQGNIDGAIDAYMKAISLARFSADAYRNLGSTLYVTGRIAEAAMVYEKWLARDPDHPVALHMRAACSGHDVPARASDAYIRACFDRFAASFDTKLKGLEYRAPDLTVAAVMDGHPVAPRLDVLDAGCGTGLCANALRTYARRLAGVDLSAGMLEKARARGLYDDIVTGELTEYMSGCLQRYDVIVCVDTLCYFGELFPAFRAAATALRPGGRFAFSVEEEVDATPEAGFRLTASGRYAHTEAYVRRMLASAGFTLRSLSHDGLRMECLRWVAGLVVVACR